MGANLYTIELVVPTEGLNIHTLFNDIVQETLITDGNDPYNGSITTTNLGYDVTHHYQKVPTEELNKLEDNENIFTSKWNTNYATEPLGYLNEEKSVEFIKVKPTYAIKKGVTWLPKFHYPFLSLRDCDLPEHITTIAQAQKHLVDQGTAYPKTYIMQYRSDGRKYIVSRIEKKYDDKPKHKDQPHLTRVLFFVYAAM